MDKEWLNNLESDIKNTMLEKTTVPAEITSFPANSKIINENKISERHDFMDKISKNENAVLLAIVFVLCVITYFVWQNKQQNYYENIPLTAPGQNIQEYSSVPPWLKQENQENSKRGDLTEAVKKIWERTKWNTDKTMLISIVQNNNVSVMQNGYPKSDLVYLNPDWTISQMPRAIKLDEEDRQFLQQFLR